MGKNRPVTAPMAARDMGEEEEARLAEQMAQLSGPVETWRAFRVDREWRQSPHITVCADRIYVPKRLAEVVLVWAGQRPVRVSVEVAPERRLMRLRLDADGLPVTVSSGGYLGHRRLIRWLASQGVAEGRYLVKSVSERERAIYVDLSALAEQGG